MPSTVLGFLVVALAVLLRLIQSGTSEWLVLALIFIGGVLVRGESLVSALRAWRTKGGNGARSVEASREDQS